MKQIISYASENFIKSQQILNISLNKYNSEIVHKSFRKEDLPSKFINKNKLHFNTKRGGGYWVWKPYIILSSLLNAKDGDYIMYVDSGLSIVNDVNILFDYFKNNKEDIILFQNHGLPNQVWTKRDCFHIMNCDNENFYFKDQVNAAIQLYRKSERSIKFVENYLAFCENFQAISDTPNIYCQNFPSFKVNRHDQSILTNLAYLNNIKLYRNPTQFGNHLLDKKFITPDTFYSYGQKEYELPFPDSHYPMIFDHHRRRFNYKDTWLKKIILALMNKYKNYRSGSN